MSIDDRILTFVEAVHEATDIEMSRDNNVVLFGLDVDDPKATFGTNRGFPEKFGSHRVFGTPLSEDAMTGAAVGMALAGIRPIHVHIRMDFMTLAMNQLINVAAKTYNMFGGAQNVPLVVRCMVGKSWGNGAQHTQSLYPLLMNVPGLKIAAPATPYDAKACLSSAVRDDNPVIYMEHRTLHFTRGPVPEGEILSPIGRARVTRSGKDITLVGISWQQVECLKAAAYLSDIGVDAEVIDPIWLSPLDVDTIEKSVRKTGHLLVVDNAWTTCGAGAEIIAQLSERLSDIKWSASRMGFAPVPCPTTPILEKQFYPEAVTIASKARAIVEGKDIVWVPAERDDLKNIEFRGPF